MFNRPSSRPVNLGENVTLYLPNIAAEETHMLLT
jgi:hypothetical protein